ncbi:MAG: polysaccharide deacetylase family protein [Pseudomonadota bacterium]
MSVFDALGVRLFAGVSALRSKGLTVLIYHRVHRQHDSFTSGDVDAVTFSWHLNVLKKHFNVVRLREAIQGLSDGEALPRNAIAITFDDGYRDNAEVALPLLEAAGLPATFFIATGFLDGGIMWNDRIIESLKRTRLSSLPLDDFGLDNAVLSTETQRADTAGRLINALKHKPFAERDEMVEALVSRCDVELPRDLMMDAAQLPQFVEAGMEIGAHTVNHPILTRIGEDVALKEIQDSRNFLEDLLNVRVAGFAYPNGRPEEDYDASHVEIVQQLGFDYAMSTRWGIASSEDNRHALPRINPWDTTPSRWTARIALAKWGR